MVIKDEDPAGGVFDAMRGTQVLFVESASGVTQMTEHEEARGLLTGWRAEHPDSLRVGYESGSFLEHIAAAPTAWLSFLLLTLSILAMAVLSFTEFDKHWPELGFFAKSAHSGFFFGACGIGASIALMCAKKVKVLEYRAGYPTETFRIGFGVSVASLFWQHEQFVQAKEPDETAVASFFRIHKLSSDGHFANLDGRVIPVGSITEIAYRRRYDGLWMLFGAAVLTAFSFFVLKAPDWVALPPDLFPHLIVGILLPLFLGLYVAAVAGLVGGVLICWTLIVFGGWAHQQFQIVVKTKNRKTIRLGDCDAKRAKLLCAAVAGLIGNKVPEAQS